MQITQESSEFNLMTNSVKFMQQTSLSLSEGDSSVLINTYYAPQIHNNVLMST